MIEIFRVEHRRAGVPSRDHDESVPERDPVPVSGVDGFDHGRTVVGEMFVLLIVYSESFFPGRTVRTLAVKHSLRAIVDLRLRHRDSV